MSITSCSGEIMSVAPDKVDAIVLWIRNGFNLRSHIFKFIIPGMNISLKLCYPKEEIELDKFYPSMHYPWRRHYDTLWKVVSQGHIKLKYIYVFSNPTDAMSENGFEKINVLINNSFNTLKLFNIKSVGLIHIPATSNGNLPTDQDDKRSAELMIQSIKNWISTNDYDLDVLLVDRTDDFAKLI